MLTLYHLKLLTLDLLSQKFLFYYKSNKSLFIWPKIKFKKLVSDIHCIYLLPQTSKTKTFLYYILLQYLEIEKHRNLYNAKKCSKKSLYLALWRDSIGEKHLGNAILRYDELITKSHIRSSQFKFNTNERFGGNV